MQIVKKHKRHMNVRTKTCNQIPFMANHYSLRRDIKHTFKNILTMYMGNAEENEDVNCCVSFAFKYKIPTASQGRGQKHVRKCST